jgi:hypothetical protein
LSGREWACEASESWEYAGVTLGLIAVQYPTGLLSSASRKRGNVFRFRVRFPGSMPFDNSGDSTFSAQKRVTRRGPPNFCRKKSVFRPENKKFVTKITISGRETEKS